MKYTSFCIIGATFLLLLNSCATYTMSREQLYATIQNSLPRKTTAEHSAAIFGSQRYLANGVRNIPCVDKKGNKKTLTNSPQIEMRITDTNGRKHLFYFDTVILEDSTFTGSNSRILNTFRSIHYANIKKVEVQNGGKAYYYSSAR